MTENVAIIKKFIEAWSNLDADEWINYFSLDGVYYNMPTKPVQGHDQLKPFIKGFIGNWTKTN